MSRPAAAEYWYKRESIGCKEFAGPTQSMMEAVFNIMFKFTASLILVGMAMPLNGATILTGNNDLLLTFNPVVDVTIVSTNAATSNISSNQTGPLTPSAFVTISNPDDGPPAFLRATNGWTSAAGTGGQQTFTLEANAALMTLRNSGRVDAVFPIAFLLTLEGSGEGPGTGQFFTRSIAETAVGSSDTWTTIFDTSLSFNWPGPLSTVDYCSNPSLCSGQLNVVVPAGGVLRVRSSVTTNGVVSEGEVPEPGSFLLAGAGLGALLLIRRRR